MVAKSCLGLSAMGLLAAQHLQLPIGKRGGGVTSVDEHYHDQLPHLKKARTDAGTGGCATRNFLHI